MKTELEITMELLQIERDIQMKSEELRLLRETRNYLQLQWLEISKPIKIL